MQVLRSSSGLFRRSRFRCKYRGQVPECSGAEGSSAKLGGGIWEPHGTSKCSDVVRHGVLLSDDGGECAMTINGGSLISVVDNMSEGIRQTQTHFRIVWDTASMCFASCSRIGAI